MPRKALAHARAALRFASTETAGCGQFPWNQRKSQAPERSCAKGLPFFREPNECSRARRLASGRHRHQRASLERSARHGQRRSLQDTPSTYMARCQRSARHRVDLAAPNVYEHTQTAAGSTASRRLTIRTQKAPLHL